MVMQGWPEMPHTVFQNVTTKDAIDFDSGDSCTHPAKAALSDDPLYQQSLEGNLPWPDVYLKPGGTTDRVAARLPLPATAAAAAAR